MDVIAVWLIAFFFLQDCVMYRMQVISLFHHAEFSRFYNSHYLFTLLFLSKQTRHGRKIVSFYFFFFRLKVVALNVYRASNVWGHECKSALCSSCSLQNIPNGDQQIWMKLDYQC